MDVWVLDLARPRAEVTELAALLAPDELRRAANMRVDAARRRFMLTRGALRVLLGRYLDADPGALELALGEHGRPRLDSFDISFNVAHSGELALLAVSADRTVGVDIELMRPRRDPLPVARRWFAPAEVAELERTHPSRRPAAFYRFWVAKEALVKATGWGLSLPLRSFEVSFASGSPHVTGTPGTRRWSIELLAAGDAYAAALASDGPPLAPPLRALDPFAAGRLQ